MPTSPRKFSMNAVANLVRDKACMVREAGFPQNTQHFSFEKYDEGVTGGRHHDALVNQAGYQGESSADFGQQLNFSDIDISNPYINITSCIREKD
ncbi:hypothetical protein FRB98_007950 [Tulasnella sp. 332]|nr:hypothetical protein FRB98_007950 [Tulasnella sp. 332]